jgi:hypothetical protein
MGQLLAGRENSLEEHQPNAYRQDDHLLLSDLFIMLTDESGLSNREIYKINFLRLLSDL